MKLNDKERNLIEDIIKEYGTPVYILFEDKIRERARYVKEKAKSIIKNIKVAYSYKANNFREVCRVFHEENLLSEVVTLHELGIAEDLGVPGESIIFNGPKKDERGIARAMEMGALLNIDSLEELGIIMKMLRREEKARVGIRVKFDIKGGPKHLGLRKEIIEKIFSKLVNNEAIEPVQLHTHIGTQVTDPSIYEVLSRELCDLASKFERTYGIKLSVDLGGGFALKSTPELFTDERAPPFEEYLLSIKRGLDSEDREVFIEPGRILIGPCAVLATKVLAIKDDRPGDGRIVIVDASSYDVPSVYFMKHQVEALRGDKEEEKDVYGSSCTSYDIIRMSVNLPREMKRGDVLLIKDVGAYTMNLAQEFIRPRPPVVMVRSDGSVKRVWRRWKVEP